MTARQESQSLGGELESLVVAVEEARVHFLATVEPVAPIQAARRPTPEAWSVAELVEHLVWAERVGVRGIWTALDRTRDGKPSWKGDLPWSGLSIEEVIDRTWGETVDAPAVALPREGGPVDYWSSALRACTTELAALAQALQGFDLEQLIYPHPISGPLNARQRLEFLRFHLDRHRSQVPRILQGLATR